MIDEKEESTDDDNHSESEEKEDKKKESKKTKNCITVDEKSGLNQIKCDVRKLFEHENDKIGIMPKGSVRIIINGKSGTGKSHLLRIILLMLHEPTHIIICTTVVGNDVHEGIRKYCKSKGIKYHFFLEPSDFLHDMSEIVEKKKTDDHIICIFDDFTDCHTGKDNEYHNCAIRAFSKWRNYNVSNIIITPDVSDIKTNIRNSSNMQILFPVENPYGHIEFKKILKNKFPKMNADYWEKLYDYISKHEYNFIMYCDTKDGKRFPHLRLNWDKVVYPVEHEGGNDDNEEEEIDEEEADAKPIKIDKRTLNKNHGYGLTERHKLLKQALEMGLPAYFTHTVTTGQLRNFLKYQTKKGGKFEGSADMLMGVIGENKPSKQTLMTRLYRNIKKYKETEKDTYWAMINYTCKELLKYNYADKIRLKHILETKGLTEE